MARYDQEWCDALASLVGPDALTDDSGMRLLYVVSDTEEGKVAFNLDLSGGAVAAATAGKLPRGEKADVTVTAKEAVLLELWRGKRSRDAAFMRGDLKIEGAYQRWLDELVPLFQVDPWNAAWSKAAG
ncbi:MAG: SCP2 sterol-binding domain-containing protein [Acidimicrobiia bacterium]|nr:SCP2 sterol-binding domain-containing protein [Acidimicrobiia bacterium]